MNLPPNMQACDLRNGVPFADGAVDVVYHPHFLEHLDHDIAPRFLREAFRALRPDGIPRIAVPNFETAAREYMQHLELCVTRNDDISQHDQYVSGLLWWSVLREATGTSRQQGFMRWLQNKILGDARKRGQTHQWMYDRINLTHLLQVCGCESVKVCTFDHSDIIDWQATDLDINPDGGEHRPGSLYIEARKPMTVGEAALAS